MSTYPNADRLEALKRLGINVSTLGCVMLDVRPMALAPLIPSEWAHTSTHPNRSHITGIQTEHHMTLLYGLLENAHHWLTAIDEVLDGWEQKTLIITDQIEVFRSPFPDEPYSCIVARQSDTDPRILDAHHRLSMLPHINTFPGYKPHITLAYVKPEFEQDAVDLLDGEIEFYSLGLNYGTKP